ncbi:hypothetical protein HBO23_31970 [Pseudomonas sp. WS 5532]|uniref:hypothetical protein n=1 Tax=Pseudomonas sp. WS 5532 TaxID=2717495 RepID=UPI0014746075|nr:hypothetical protein [Pseudomonas sp. WS 5532]NMX77587.1 hypothetical protein [Pseudomonas sp. WS 5532]
MAEAEKDMYSCGLCHFEFASDVKICQGCHGFVVFGATEAEKAEGAKTGAVVWGGSLLAAVYILPSILQQVFGWHIPIGWGMGLYGLIFPAVGSLIGNFRGRAAVEAKHAGTCRTIAR